MKTSKKIAEVPDDLGPDGREVWLKINEKYDLNGHELELLAQAARTSDLVARLQVAVDAAPLLVAAQGGSVKVNPLVVELRAQRMTLARLLAALQIPADDATAAPRSQRRSVRGVYGIAGDAS